MFIIQFAYISSWTNLVSDHDDQILSSSLKTETKEIVSPGQNPKKQHHLSELQDKNDMGLEVAQSEPELSKEKVNQTSYQTVLNSHREREWRKKSNIDKRSLKEF